MDEKALRERYRQLLERRRTAGEPSVPLETLEALAENRLGGAERVTALEAVYADPAARAEFEFLRELARARPRPPDRRRVWLAAAALLVVVGGGLVWRTLSPADPDPLRGPAADVELLAPAPGARLAEGDTLVWRRTPGAVQYVVEVITAAGDVAFSAETSDTIVVLGQPLGSHEGPAQWWVTARLGGTASVRSTPRRITLAP